MLYYHHFGSNSETVPESYPHWIELIQPEQDNELETNDIEGLISTSSNPDLKPGLKLPQPYGRLPRIFFDHI